MMEIGDLRLEDIKLPPSVVSKVDVSHMLSELERVDDDLTTRSVKQRVGVETDQQPKVSEQLADFLQINSLQIGDSQQRTELIRLVRQLKEELPVVHLTFSTVADRESLEQIVDWLRRSVHAQSVVSVGLQPSLVGGVYIRTPNKVHDLSIRAQLSGNRHLILEEVEALSAGV